VLSIARYPVDNIAYTPSGRRDSNRHGGSSIARITAVPGSAGQLIRGSAQRHRAGPAPVSLFFVSQQDRRTALTARASAEAERLIDVDDARMLNACGAAATVQFSSGADNRAAAEPHRHVRGVLATSTVIMLSRITDPSILPVGPLITAMTLAELTVGPLVAATESERAARQAHVQQAEAGFEPLPFDAPAARAFGRVAASMRSAGRKPAARAYDAISLRLRAARSANGRLRCERLLFRTGSRGSRSGRRAELRVPVWFGRRVRRRPGCVGAVGDTRGRRPLRPTCGPRRSGSPAA
jgi:tRNA(fMet)-specific endonuclease VapC